MSCEQAELLFSCFPHIVARINVDLLPGRASVQSLFQQQQHTHTAKIHVFVFHLRQPDTGNYRVLFLKQTFCCDDTQ